MEKLTTGAVNFSEFQSFQSWSSLFIIYVICIWINIYHICIYIYIYIHTFHGLTKSYRIPLDYNNSKSWRTCLMTKFFRLFRKFIPFSMIISLSSSSQIANRRTAGQVERFLATPRRSCKPVLFIVVAKSSDWISTSWTEFLLEQPVNVACWKHDNPGFIKSFLGEASTATSGSSSQRERTARSSCTSTIVSASRCFFRRLRWNHRLLWVLSHCDISSFVSSSAAQQPASREHAAAAASLSNCGSLALRGE